MPRYDDDRPYRKRRTESSQLPERAERATSKRDRDHHHSSRQDKERDSRLSASPTSSPERRARPGRGRDQGSRHDRSCSRDTRRRHRSRSGDRNDKKSSRRHRSRSPASRSPSRRSISPRPVGRSKKPLPQQRDAFSKTPLENSESSTPAPDKQKPNFSNSGLLAAETNTVRAQDGSASIVLKYHEPPEARKPSPKEPWRLYVFKGEDLLDTVDLGGRSCWLIGKEKLVADLPIEHPGCSKQHAALQFRYIEKRNEFGDRDGRVRPYVIDLESANGTTVNGEPAPHGRYMELMDKDILKFGLSTREYVLMLPPPG